MMEINVLFFATLKDLTGTRKLSLTFAEETIKIDGVKDRIIEQFPDIQDNLQIALVAINDEYAFKSEMLQDGDEIAFFPPVSGGDGMPSRPEIFQLPHNPVDHDALIKEITTPEAGAVVVFSGLVRGETTKKGHIPRTDYLEYEAYESMALAKMKQVADEIRSQYSDVIGIAIVQRLGKLAVGDNTILVACSSAHRDSGCFEGARYGINRLKEIVPVWKKEIGQNGELWIEGEYKPTADDRAGNV